MFLKTVAVLAAAAAAVAASSSQRNYEGYSVLRTSALTAGQVKAVGDLSVDSLGLDLWTRPVAGHAAEVMASPADMPALREFFEAHGIDHTVKVEDVEAAIAASKEPSTTPRKFPKSPRYNLDWDDYYGHDDLNQFVDELASTYSFCDSFSIGQSAEGRDMRVLSITKAGAGKPNVFIEAGIHAREWISPAVATYTVRELLENYDAHPQYVDNINWYLLPSANPDGYEYSRSSDRLWRKSRSDTGSALGCKGVDLNRNWAYHWGESGVSFDKCSDVYCGTEGFSEVESQNIRDFWQTLDPAPEITICFHSAAELWLYPYGYDYNQYPDNVDEIRRVCEASCDALNAVNGQTFQCINSAELYPAAGASDDWYESEGSRFTYTPELRDNGFGFLLPPSLILPSCEEIWAAWEVMLAEIV